MNTIGMKSSIMENIENPGQLEKLYRLDKNAFKREFNLLYPEIQEVPVARVWNERLNFQGDEIVWGRTNELTFVIVASLIAGLIPKIPSWTGLDEESFFMRNLSFAVFPFLAAYFAWRDKASVKKIFVVTVIMLLSVLYINFLPGGNKSDTLILACIHLPLFLWATLGFTFVGGNLQDYHRRIDFLKYNGDLVVMLAILLISGALLTVITFGLFTLIDVKIEKIYTEYIIVWGLASAPIVGTYLVQCNPQLVGKVSPVIARVFTPLVLVMLVIYLLTVLITGKDPYNDREFLLVFNFLLVGVMALIHFSVAESSGGVSNRVSAIMLLSLAAVTIVVNGIALSAIVYRITEWGITPNRLAVLGGNILILSNLLLVAWKLFKMAKKKGEITSVEWSIAAFLPVYSAWTILVTFLFPLIFYFR